MIMPNTGNGHFFLYKAGEKKYTTTGFNFLEKNNDTSFCCS